METRELRLRVAVNGACEHYVCNYVNGVKATDKRALGFIGGGQIIEVVAQVPIYVVPEIEGQVVNADHD